MAIGADGQSYETEMHYQLGIPQIFPGDDEQDKKPVTASQSSNEVSTPKKIYFIRHGETDENEANRCRGWTDVSLNEDGRADAKKAASSVKSAGVDLEHIVASPLRRAQETARIVSHELGGLPVETHPGLAAQDMGDFTGRPNDEVKDMIEMHKKNGDSRIPGSSESWNEFKSRVLGAMSDITSAHADKEVGVVSHNSVADAIKEWTDQGQPEKQMGVLNWLRGQPTQQSAEAAIDPRAWPTDRQSDEYRDTNMSYGDPNARFLQPGLASTKQISGLTFGTIDQMVGVTPDEQRKMIQYYSKAKPIDLQKADELNKAYIASRRSALSQLGFDLEHYYEPEDRDLRLNTAGITGAKSNEMWADAKHYNDPPSSPIHEAMHRGMEKLREAGRLKNTPYEKYSDLEEYLIRRMTERHFGEKSSPGPEGERLLKIARGTIPDKDLDMIEKESANLIAKKRPGGPR